MDNLDQSYKAFIKLAQEIPDYAETLFTEQDTRVKVVDRFLVKVLNWPFKNIQTESRASKGYVDYLLTHSGFARCVLEAKKDGIDFGLKSRSSGHHYKLNGPAFAISAVRSGIDQAIEYCAHRNAELACLTNGREWVIFRGSRLGDGRATLDGHGFVFSDLESIDKHFSLFYDLFGYENVIKLKYRAYFQEAEGVPIRPQVVRKALRTSESRNLISSSPITADVDRIMTSFFRRLSGDADPELLTKCFVVTKESVVADENLARISTDLLNRIRSLRTDNADELTELIERAKTTQRNEFVVLVGTKGAGKSTFIDRFFRHVIPGEVSRSIVVAKVNLALSDGHEGNVTDWLNAQLLAALEHEIFGADAATFDDLRGMFFDDYMRRSKGPYKILYETNREQFKIEFGRFIEDRREHRPHEYIQRLLGHVVRVRKMLPCLIFDNADHFTIEFQEKVYQYARSIYENQLCLIVLPITDRTSWQLSRQGALRSFESESLYLPTPSPQVVLRKRIEFLEERLIEEKDEPERKYFFGRGIRLSIENLTAFSATIQQVFLNTGRPALWISLLANSDVRRCLEIAKFIITSPHLEIEELFKLYIDGSTIDIPKYKIQRALIRGKYDIYPNTEHPYLQNVFSLDDEMVPTPLLGLRLIQLLRDSKKSDARNPFMHVEQIVDYFKAMLIEPQYTIRWIGRMLDFGMCQCYDPTVTDIQDASRLQITPSGFFHLRWGLTDWDYIHSMLEIVPISCTQTYDRLHEFRTRPLREVWADEICCFIEYLQKEDELGCCIPDHDAYQSQLEIAWTLGDTARKLERHMSNPSISDENPLSMES